MKRLFCILLCCALILFFMSACSKSSGIVGEWIVDSYVVAGEEIVSVSEATDMFGSAFAVFNGSWIVFFDDGTCSIRSPESPDEYEILFANYTIAGSTIKLSADGRNDELLSIKDGLIYAPSSELVTIRFTKSANGISLVDSPKSTPEKDYADDLTRFSHTAFGSSEVTMADVIDYESRVYGCENYEESTGQVGTTLYFESKSNKLRDYLFQDGLLKEYTFYIHDETIYNQIINELNVLYGPADDDILDKWHGNIDGHPAKIFSNISSSVLDKDFSAWVCISYSKQ